MLTSIFRFLRTLLRHVLLFPISLLDACRNGLLAVYRPFKPSWTFEWNDQHYKSAQDQTQEVTHQPTGSKAPVHFRIHTPNMVCRFRAETFSTKEPETLEWIESYGGAGALYDIGANVGLYSIYYGLVHSGPVYAFEPSVFNLRLLAQNAHLNGLQNRIHIVPNPLSNQIGFADFRLQSPDEGGALSAFGVDYGHDGKPLSTAMSYLALGATLDFLVETKAIHQPPRLIKVDVDGIEHLILEGARNTLKHPDCISVLIEVNDNFASAAGRVKEILESSGFSLTKKAHGEMFDDGGPHSASFNQIWVKNGSNLSHKGSL